MSTHDTRLSGNQAEPQQSHAEDSPLPPDAVALVELRATAVERRLGYFRAERFVIFAYCPGGGEVIWKDGHSSGFGTGAWRMFLEEIAPLAAQYDVDLGGLESIGTHVLLLDRSRGVVYAAPRNSAEQYLAQAN
ncbi:MAG TPA: hypothetical protein VG722_05905, partial [Tepidisphaeraceae bacterium]|nr:hypothetical protein [Tepidisphaeraceae bacterium]